MSMADIDYTILGQFFHYTRNCIVTYIVTIN